LGKEQKGRKTKRLAASNLYRGDHITFFRLTLDFKKEGRQMRGREPSVASRDVGWEQTPAETDNKKGAKAIGTYRGQHPLRVTAIDQRIGNGVSGP